MDTASERLESRAKQIGDAIASFAQEAYLLGYEHRQQVDDFLAGRSHTVGPQPCPLGRLRKFEDKDGDTWYETPDGRVHLNGAGIPLDTAEANYGPMTEVTR